VGLGFDHGPALLHHLGHRDGLEGKGQLPGLDEGEVEELVDQKQQVPPGL